MSPPWSSSRPGVPPGGGRSAHGELRSLRPNTVAPLHTHEEEQITVVIEGELEFDLAGDLRNMRPGMAVVVPPWVPHGARTHDSSCLEIDIFHPPRRALLELTQASSEHLGETEAPFTPPAD